MQDKKIISIIPARAGSKRLPHKNIKILCGKPLIYYSIKISQISDLIHRTLVSTDDEKIADIAVECGSEVIKRPVELASDEATTISVLEHSLRYLKEKEGYEPDLVVTLQPTTPLRTKEYVDKAINLLLNNSDCDSVLGISEIKINCGALKGEFFIPHFKEGIRKQDMANQYKVNGVIYVTKKDVIKKNKSILGSKILGYMTDPLFNINIDTQLDFDIAGSLLERYEIFRFFKEAK